MSRRLRPHEFIILKILEASRFKMTTSEIATETRMGWKTARKTLERLYKEKYATKQRKGNRIYWDLR